MAPAAAQVWGDAVRDIAAFRNRNHVTDRSTPFGPVPADPSVVVAWQSAAVGVAESRVWLDTYSPAPTVPPRARTLAELTERRSELDAILAAAPTDQRHIVQALTSGQLTLGDTTEILRDALTQQGDRRRWILEHWPHIIESAEIDRGFEAASSAGNMPFDPDAGLTTVPHELMLDFD